MNVDVNVPDGDEPVNSCENAENVTGLPAGSGEWTGMAARITAGC